MSYAKGRNAEYPEKKNELVQKSSMTINIRGEYSSPPNRDQPLLLSAPPFPSSFPLPPHPPPHTHTHTHTSAANSRLVRECSGPTDKDASCCKFQSFKQCSLSPSLPLPPLPSHPPTPSPPITSCQLTAEPPPLTSASAPHLFTPSEFGQLILLNALAGIAMPNQSKVY